MATDCTVIAMATSFVARLHEGPQLLYALLIGVSFHFLHENVTIRPGIEFCTGIVLRLGVALVAAPRPGRVIHKWLKRSYASDRTARESRFIRSPHLRRPARSVGR